MYFTGPSYCNTFFLFSYRVEFSKGNCRSRRKQNLRSVQVFYWKMITVFLSSHRTFAIFSGLNNKNLSRRLALILWSKIKWTHTQGSIGLPMLNLSVLSVSCSKNGQKMSQVYLPHSIFTQVKSHFKKKFWSGLQN